MDMHIDFKLLSSIVRLTEVEIIRIDAVVS